jgi:hypothetical protein
VEEKVIEIRDDLKADVRKLVLLAQHHEQILASIKGELANLLRLGHGVNINDPQTIVDAEGGVIVQRTPVSVEATPAPSGDVVDADSPTGQ